MKNFGAKWLALALVTAVGAVASVSLNGCSDGPSGGTAGTTGGAGRGGTTGQAGRGGTGGGTAGTGGASAGRGGSSAGTGGATAGTGGGTAGTGGVGGGGLPCPGVGTFDTNDMMGFALNTFMDSAAGATVNLAVREAGARATLSWSGTEGDPSPGALKVDAPFDDYKQMVDIQKVWGATMLKAWTGYKLHVRVKVMGGNPSAMNPMGVQPYVNTGASFGGYCGKYTNLVAGNGWNDYVLDLSTCTAPADPSMVIAFGVSIQAGDGSNGDGGVNTAKPMMATIYVDSFWLEGSCGTGGTGGGTAGSGGRGGTGGTAGSTAGSGGSTAGSGGATAGSGGATAGSGGATAGSGGATAGSGGATAGSGGATAGSGGTGGGNVDGGTSAFTAGFDTTLDSFGLNTFNGTRETGNLAVQPDGGGATLAMIVWDGTQGMGTPVGSAKITAPYSAYNQFVDVNRNFGMTTKQDWTGKTSLKVRFKVTEGFNPDPAFPAGAQVYAQTTDGYVGLYGWNNVAAGTDWQVATLALAPASPPTNWNLAQVIQIGVNFQAGSGTGADGAVASGPPTAATIYIDSIWAE